MITHLDVPVVRIYRVPRYQSEHSMYYYIIKDVNTMQNLGTETSLSEACRKIDEEGWILSPDK